jgi:hypothetical protein
LATLTGTVVDSYSAAPISGAVVSIPNTTLTATTNSSGAFSLINVPLNATQIVVTSPNIDLYLNYAEFAGGAASYDQNNGHCPLPLPKLSAGTNPLGTIDLLDHASPPPPPGCPS